MTLDGVANDGGESDNVGVDVEDIVGGSGNDSLVGNDGPNQLFANGGNDTLVGGAYDDRLDGGVGTDSLVGGDGIDTPSYTGRTENLTIVLDGIFNDGAAGENDKIDATTENVDGGDAVSYTHLTLPTNREV